MRPPPEFSFFDNTGPISTVLVEKRQGSPFIIRSVRKDDNSQRIATRESRAEAVRLAEAWSYGIGLTETAAIPSPQVAGLFRAS